MELSPRVEQVSVPRLPGLIWMTGGGRWDGDGTFDFVSGRGEASAWIDVANGDRPGLALTKDTVRLFTGATGLGSLCVRDLGKALVFASEPDPLIELGDVTTNWGAWVDILTLGYPQGSATTVEQVFRLEPATSLVLAPHGWRMERYRPYWEAIDHAT